MPLGAHQTVFILKEPVHLKHIFKSLSQEKKIVAMYGDGC